MKKITYTLTSLFILALAFSSCHKDKTITPVTTDPNTGEVFAITGDQVGRPGIATVFVAAADKDNFNATTPSTMGPLYQAKFQAQLQAYNGGAFTTNLLGLTAAQFTGVLATDVLNVSTTGTTTYYDGTNVLTGRNLSDDVIDVSLILIFGGPTDAANPTLTSDHVDKTINHF